MEALRNWDALVAALPEGVDEDGGEIKELKFCLDALKACPGLQEALLQQRGFLVKSSVGKV